MKKTITVTFAGDYDVVQHIQHVEDKEKATKLRSRKERTVTFSTGQKNRKSRQAKEEIVESSSDEDDSIGPPSALGIAAGDTGAGLVPGSDVFQFKKVKKSGQMAQKATEARTPKKSDSNTKVTDTPGKSKGKTPNKTPKKQPQQVLHADDQPSTPVRRSARRPQATTPYQLWKRNKEGDSSSNESDDSSSSDSSDDDNQKEEPSNQMTTSGKQNRQAGRRRKIEEIEYNPNAEQYFDLHSGNAVTSDRTLSKLDTPQMDQESLCALLKSEPGTGSHVKQCQGLINTQRDLFSKWMFHMCNDFNILLYGLGSKRALLEDFRKRCLKDFSHVVVNGYFPSLTVRHILNSITDDILGYDGTFRTPTDQYEFIKSHFEEGDYQDFFIIIHNIDGAMLRGEKTQNILSLMAQVRGVHVVASIDHINAPLIWDHTKCSRFNWVWYDATTYIPYASETSYENSLLVQQTGALALSSLTHVMKSLTPNAKGIFLLLAKHQLENQDNSNYIGMSFGDLYQRCREAFLVNSDLTLRAQLTEFRDHKILRSKKCDGVEHLIMPIDAATLTEFLEQQDNS